MTDEHLRTAGRTVLVVDDDPGIRESVREVLSTEGYQVLEAATAHDAFKLLQERPDIDLVFTDIMIPGIDGFKLAGMVRMSNKRTRVLFATGYMDLALIFHRRGCLEDFHSKRPSLTPCLLWPEVAAKSPPEVGYAVASSA